MSNKISLAGDLGSGKSTVAAILIDALGAEYYSTGRLVRSIAEKMGMDINGFNKYMETHPEIDTEIDDGLAALSDDERPLVIDSRMAWHFVRDTFRVYMTVDIEVSALRIMYAKRQDERSGSVREMADGIRARRKSERLRYLNQYGVDIMDFSNYDLVIDTTAASAEEVAERILSAYREWCDDKSKKLCFLSSERLRYPDDEADTALVAEYSDRLDLGEAPPMPEAYYEDGVFYLVSNVESALAYSFSMYSFIPVSLVGEKPENVEFIEMKNSL